MQFVIGILINILSGKAAVNNVLVTSLIRGISVWMFFSSGMIFHEFMMARTIKKQKVMKNKYTRAMVPSFIFMVLDALFHGKTIFSLYKKFDVEK